MGATVETENSYPEMSFHELSSKVLLLLLLKWAYLGLYFAHTTPSVSFLCAPIEPFPFLSCVCVILSRGWQANSWDS